MSYLNHSAQPRHPRATPQSQPIPNTTVPQVPNHAGGFSWEVTPWTRVDRFLILGTEKGTYYVGEKKLTKMHVETIQDLLTQGDQSQQVANGLHLVDRIVEISQKALAPKNDPALFALALASAKGQPEVRAAALAALPQVARTATHLFDFLTFRQSFGGWGRGLRRAVSAWYLARSAGSLALQIIKYRQRNGWTHRDVIRKAHVVPFPGQGVADNNDGTHLPMGAVKADLIRYAVKGLDRERLLSQAPAAQEAEAVLTGIYPHRLVQGYEMASRSPSPKVTAGLIREYGLPREAVLTDHLNAPEVWQALLDADMPITALIRNLATMTRVGLLKPLSGAVGQVTSKLADQEALVKGRVHPIQILTAAKTYGSGKGVRGSGVWSPVPQILDALTEAFYLSFGSVEPTGKRILTGLDVSGSMRGTEVNGVPGLTAIEAESAMALVTAATEKAHGFVAFDTEVYPLDISPRQRLDDVVRKVGSLVNGGTNCALPITYALYAKLPVDAFVIYTDSETWQGSQHPAQAIREYRQRTGIAAKMVVVAMASTGNSIADPGDSGVMNVVGFDPSVPNLISQFIGG